MRPNDPAHQPGRPERKYTPKDKNAGPVWCSGWVGVLTLNAPEPASIPLAYWAGRLKV